MQTHTHTHTHLHLQMRTHTDMQANICAHCFVLITHSLASFAALDEACLLGMCLAQGLEVVAFPHDFIVCANVHAQISEQGLEVVAHPHDLIVCAHVHTTHTHTHKLVSTI